MKKSAGRDRRSSKKIGGETSPAAVIIYIRGGLAISLYYVVIFFLDHYFFTPFLRNFSEQQVYSASSTISLIAFTAVGFFLILLPPLLYGRFHLERSVCWGLTSFLCYALSNLITQNVFNALGGKPPVFYLGFAYRPVTVRNALSILYILALFCSMSLVGRAYGIGIMRKATRIRTRSKAIG